MRMVVSIYPSKSASAPAMSIGEDIEVYGATVFGISPGRLRNGLRVLPVLAATPTIVRDLSISRRQASEATVSINIFHSGLEIIDKAESDFLRVRVYTVKQDGDAIDLLEPIFDGHIDNIAMSQSRGVVAIDASEYDERLGSAFPPDVITRADFPDAPDIVAGVVSKQVVIGEFQFPIPARQVDRHGRLFYICDPPLSSPPAIVYADGRVVPSGSYSFHVLRMASSGLEYTALLFPEPISSIMGAPVQWVAVSHGHGLRFKNGIEILANVAGVRMTRRAYSIVGTMEYDFPMTVLLNKRDNALAILMRRLFPQTVFVPRMYLGLLDALAPDIDSSPVALLRPGDGFLFGQTGISRAGYADVVNNLQVNVGMTHHGGPALRRPLMQIVRSPTQGPRDLRALASKSQAIYGPRALSIDAGDLRVSWAAGGVPYSVSGERLANYIIRHSAIEGVRYTYACSDSTLSMFELGDVVELSDPLIDRNPVRAVVVRQEFSNVPSVTFEHIFV